MPGKVGREVAALGARPDQRHVPAQHVDQLRQLIQRVPAQPAAGLGHPGVPAHLEQDPVHLVVGFQIRLLRVDVLLDVPTSSVALALQSVAREKNKVYLNVGAASSALTGAQCSPNFIHWCYDTYMLSKSTGGAMVKAGGDTWYFITPNYAFGEATQRDGAG